MSYFSADALQGKHVLITGATGGIGYQTAIVVAGMGAKVTVTGRNKEKLSSLADEIRDVHPDAAVFVQEADISIEEERKKLVTTAEVENGPVTLLVNCAGISGGGPVEELKQEEMDKIMHLNYTVPVLLSQLVYPGMKENGGGAVVNVSSLSGLRGTPGNTAYAASKFALIGFTHCFATEAAEHGVRVNAVCPGYVDTEMGRNGIAKRAEQYGRSFEEQFKAAEENYPSKRITTPEEVANSIAFLLTDAAGNIVGESLKISGGSVLH